MLPLIIAPNSILKRVAADINLPVSAEVVALAQNMVKAMVHYKGIGLAAPQVGQSVKLIVVATPNSPTVYINPQIIKYSWKKITMEEGCLSIPGVFGMVKRPQSVRARYLTLDGALKEEKLDGMVARIYQHEVDHVNGVLFIDRKPKILAGAELLPNYVN